MSRPQLLLGVGLCPLGPERIKLREPEALLEADEVGRSVGALSKVCRCPAWVKHQSQSQVTQAKADPAARYPRALCEKVAKLVVATWKRVSNLEW